MKHRVFLFVSGLIFLGSIIASAFILQRGFVESEKNQALAEEIRSLQEEAHRIDRENARLRDRIDYLGSDEFREREAKRVLEYQRTDEKVVIVRDHTPEHRFLKDSDSSVSESGDSETIFQKWMRFLFGMEF